MAQILVRNLDEQIVERLKERAQRRGRSLQAEAKEILTQAAGIGFKEAGSLVRLWQKRLTGREIPNSTHLIRADRER